MTSAPWIGAQWVRAALQVNPYEYKGNPSPASKYPDEASYNKALLDQCEALKIKLIAVTDHWCATSAAGLIADAEARGIIALPGFEANTSEGVHLLVIFERGTKLDDITLAIGACGLTPGDPHAVATKGYSDIVEEMVERLALVIPAHVNVATSGLLHRVSGKPLEPMIKNEDVHALGVSPGVTALSSQTQIFNNSNPFKRKHALVALHADDIMSPANLSSLGGTSWFKMSEPCLAGLVHAIKTPETRVSLVDPTSTSRVLLREISWVGGFLDGQKLPLAEDLTTLIGGRGTGKSTTIESLRYVLDISPIGEAAKKDHDDVVKNVIRTATTISLTVDVVSPTAGRYVIERTVPDPPIVRDSIGLATSLQPRDIVGNLEIFGQHELAELAQDKTLMAQMVSRVAGKPQADIDRPEILQALADNRDALEKLERDELKLEEELADIPRLTEQAKKFNESDLGAKLELRTTLAAESAIYEEAGERLGAVHEALTAVEFSDLAAQLRASLDGIDGSPREAELKPARNSLEGVAKVLEATGVALEKALQLARKDLNEAKGAWSAKVKPTQDANDEVFRKLIEEGHEPDAFMKTTAQLDKLTKRSEQRKVLATRRSKLLTERRSQMTRLADNDAAIAKELNEAIGRANKATSSTVVVKPIADPDRSKLKSVIDKHFKTQRTTIMSAIESDGFSSRAFVEAARKGKKALEPYGLSDSQLKNLLELGEPLLRELEEHSIGSAVDVQLNVAPKGQGVDLRRLEDLSKGQRATALLLLLLGASNSPLVVDQPEDDLDNRFVYDGVVARLRALKGTRQIILSTHNANVPVLGDAELVITLEGNGRNGWAATDGVGSLDAKSVRAYAEDLLEGGRDAFSARQHLYGF